LCPRWRAGTRSRRSNGPALLDADFVVLTNSRSQPLMLTPLVSRAMQSNAALANPDNKYNIPWASITVGEQIAAGASGVVFRGFYNRNPVALKQLFCADDREMQFQLGQEVRGRPMGTQSPPPLPLFLRQQAPLSINPTYHALVLLKYHCCVCAHYVHGFTCVRTGCAPWQPSSPSRPSIIWRGIPPSARLHCDGAVQLLPIAVDEVAHGRTGVPCAYSLGPANRVRHGLPARAEDYS
jgi:hypothetical protein